MNDLHLEPTPCIIPGCPLLGVVERAIKITGRDQFDNPVEYTKEGRSCTYHETGKLNAFDTRRREGLTVGKLMKGYARRRSIVRHWAWLWRKVRGFQVEVYGAGQFHSRSVQLYATDGCGLTDLWASLPIWSTPAMEELHGSDAAEEVLEALLVKARDKVLNPRKYRPRCSECGQFYPEDE